LEDTSLKVDVALERIQYAIWYCQDAQVLEITGWILTQTGLTTTQTAWALEYTGFALTSLGNLDESDAARLEAIRILDNAPSDLYARVLYGLMMNAYKHGHYDTARDWARRCREMCQTVGATAYLINVCTMEGVFAAIAGDIPAGIASLETARNEARRIGHSTYQFAALANLFELHFQQGDIAQAQACLEEILHVRPTFFDPFEEAGFTRCQSQALWFTGELGAALERATYAIELDERSNAMEHRQLGRLVAAGLSLQLHDIKTAQPLLEEVHKLMTDSSIGFHRVDLEFKTAQFEMLIGQSDTALKRLEALDMGSAQASEVTRQAILKAKALMQLEQPQAALEIIKKVPASQELENSANLILLQLALEPDSTAARVSAQELLNSGRTSALTNLELQIALEGRDISKAQFQKLYASLEGHLEAQHGLLERFGAVS
jgi:tetratricopeptide (TPR) repeat protein